MTVYDTLDPAPAGTQRQRGISVEEVTKIYPGGVVAVDDVTLEIEQGEFMVLVGPSGCGKTTLLRIIAGLEEVSSGRVLLAGEDVTAVRARDRDLAMVFQNYALYPHMTVGENLGFSLKLRKVPKAQRAARVGEVAAVLGLEGLLSRKPGELSGGQRQRVAMGRAMVREPKAFLMDEPLSNLDAKLRVSMRAELARLHERLRVTTVYVTHDQVEAMTLGQRVAVLRDGILQQVDTPQALFREPANLFVAAFIGSPSMNLAEAAAGGGRVRFAGFDLPLPPGAKLDTDRLVVGIRPTDFLDPDAAPADLPRITVTATVVEDLGAEAHVIFAVDAPRVSVDAVRAAADTTHDGDDALLVDDERALFTARVDAHHAVAPGQQLELAIDPRRLHFFDAATGSVLGRRPLGVVPAQA